VCHLALPSLRCNVSDQIIYALLCVAGVALDNIDLPFADQAWHLATPSFCLAGVALMQWAGSGGALGPHWPPVTFLSV